MNIVLITKHDVNNIHSFSGTAFFAARALQKYCDKLTCYVVYEQKLPAKFLLNQIKLKLSLLNLKRNWITTVFLKSSEIYDRIKRDSSICNIDCIILFLYRNIRFSKLKNIPTIFFSDASFHANMRMLEGHLNIPETEKAKRLQEENNISNGVKLSIFSSRWAAESFMFHHKKNSNQVKVVHFGPNLLSTPQNEYINNLIHKKPNKKPTILIFGKGKLNDFKRKTGPLVEIFNMIKKKIPEINVNVVGFSSIPNSEIPPIIQLHPYIDKATKTGNRKIAQIFESSDIFFLPSKFDYTPIVICEAMAFGLPIVAHDVGGISDYVVHGKNGYLINSDSKISDYVAIFENIFHHTDKYREMSLFSRKMYDQRNNWDCFGQYIINSIKYLKLNVTD